MSRDRACVLVVVLAVLASACSSGGDVQALEPIESSTTEATTTSTEAETTTTEVTTATSEVAAEVARPELDPANWQTESDEIFGRYLLYWQAIDEAYGPPKADPDLPALDELARPEALAEIRENIQAFQDFGELIVVPEDSVEDHILWIPDVVPLDKTEGNEVVIQDCWLQDNVRQTEAGEVLEETFKNQLLNVTMQVIDGEWRLFASVTASDESTGWDECNQLFEDLQP